MKEIGGFLGLEWNHGREFYEQGIALNSGRNCLRYLIRARKIKKIWLPKLLCSAISDTCLEEKTEIFYYSVDDNLRPVLTEVTNRKDWVYLINFYGQYGSDEIVSYANEYKNLIVDNVQAFYTKPIKGLDTIYTCRKFFGVPDGGYLYTDCRLSEMLQKDESYNRLTFLAGRLERSANEFYSAYRENEQRIDELPLRRMSIVTQNLLRGINYDQIKKVREQNFRYLHQCLKHFNQVELCVPDGPYMYPLLLENGAEIRKKLQEKKIYVPTLWPNVVENLSQEDAEYSLAENILPLPCDQRYGVRDMEYVVKQILDGMDRRGE